MLLFPSQFVAKIQISLNSAAEVNAFYMSVTVFIVYLMVLVFRPLGSPPRSLA